MKKVTYTAIVVLISIISFVSCKKESQCHCTFNNNVVFSKDLGNQTKSNAAALCNSYDSTVPGEVWTCTVY